MRTRTYMLSILAFAILLSAKLSAQPLDNHLVFDGNNDYISLNKMDVSGNAITLEALINTSNINNCSTGDCRIISKALGITEPDHYWMLSTINSGGNTVLRFRLKTNGTTTTLIGSTGIISENTWHHVAATYDGTTMKLFLNGIQVGSTPKTGSLTTNPAVDTWIGNNPPSATTRPWQGAIDEVRIWNIARTQAQLQANRNTELLGTEAGLQAYYKFNEDVGQTINDEAGNNNTFLGSTNSVDTNDPTRVVSNPPMNSLNLKILLEGAIPAGQTTMANNLFQQGVIPQGQPYSISPWNYTGTEGSSWSASDYPTETIDWVLISLQSSLDPASTVARVAAVLLQDGTLSPVDLDLSSIPSPVHIVIEHRNHLPIITSQAIPIINNTLTHDFTAENSYAPTGFGQKRVGNQWMMYAGNADQTDVHRYDINAADLVFWETVNGLGDTYNAGDYNLDADVNDADRLLFTVNNGIYSGLYETTPPDTVIVVPDCSANSYASIEAAAPSWNCLETHNEYLAAFLALNPDVAFWNQDTLAQCIEIVNEPPITGTVVSINSTGQNDTNLIKQAATQAGSGGLVNGNGETYRIGPLALTTAAFEGVTFKDMKLVPYFSNGSILIIVDVPDVSFISCPVDMQEKKILKAFEIRDNADRFAMVNGGISNYLNTFGYTGDILKINEGVDDVYIVNNEFINGIGRTPSSSTGGSRVRTIRIGGNSTNDSKLRAPERGIIASNLFENLQADGVGDDADAMVFNGFDVELQYAKGQRMLVMANIGINAGKRLIKLQSGGVDAHSNFNWWKDANGPLGERRTRAHYDNQGTSSARWTNNSARTDHTNVNSESYFMTMQNHRWSQDFEADNLVYKCNMYEHNDDTSNGRLGYAFSIKDQDLNSHDPALSPWPLNSEMTNNIVTGTGVLKYVWWFRDGNDPFGDLFLHKPNTISVQYENLYRQ